MLLAVNHIPLTRSGKIDRSKLRSQATKIAWTDGASGTHHTSQRSLTQIERKIQLMAARVLEVNPDVISMDCRFFQMGGDSIRAMQLVSLALHEGLLVTVRQLFNLPVLEDLAREAQRSTAVLHSTVSVAKPFKRQRSRIVEKFALGRPALPRG